ncbi:MAG: ribonuclease H family protein, partial [Bacteroidaceae bacterium]|nr:ribonuclease H family protein [Bacteroidaceae bacterium]
MASVKYYVVWVGAVPGIYTSWEECRLQVESWKGAVYKGFETREEAERAFAGRPDDFLDKKAPSSGRVRKKSEPRPLPQEVLRNALAVDAACSGNPGQMEYRGIFLGANQEVFHFGPTLGTNNIGEFLAIVHALALLRNKGLDWPIYSDSRNAILWVKAGQCKTKLARTAETEELFRVISRAESWLQQNRFRNSIIKWDTKRWGEIPADFGRK